MSTQMMTQGCAGFTADDVNAMWAENILDGLRFTNPDTGEVDVTERILARYGEDSTARFPEAEVLEGMGINVVLLAQSGEKGLVIGDVAACIENGTMKASDVNSMLRNIVAGELSVDDANTGVFHLAQSDEAGHVHQGDLIEQGLHRAGICSCHVEMVG